MNVNVNEIETGIETEIERRTASVTVTEIANEIAASDKLAGRTQASSDLSFPLQDHHGTILDHHPPSLYLVGLQPRRL